MLTEFQIQVIAIASYVVGCLAAGLVGFHLHKWIQDRFNRNK